MVKPDQKRWSIVNKGLPWQNFTGLHQSTFMGLSTNNNNGHGIIYVGHCNSLAGGLVTFCLLDESSLMSFQNGLSDSFLLISAWTASRISLLFFPLGVVYVSNPSDITAAHCMMVSFAFVGSYGSVVFNLSNAIT